MKKINILKISAMMLITSVSGIYMACQPDEFGDGNGLTDPEFAASSFKVTPISGTTNKFLLTVDDVSKALGFKWDKGDGTYLFGNATDTLFLPDVGTYTIGLTVIGKGGVEATTTKDIVITTPDPNAGNLVLGGKFETADDISKWTVLNISASGTTWAFDGGKATVTGGGWNQQGFYQTINVVSGKTYKIDLNASSTSGVSNTWFEVYCSTTAPVQNNDYTADGIKRNINTWDGCGTSAFSGKVSAIGCNDSKNGGTFTATADGVMYLVIKCGGEDLKSGISVDNVEVRGQ
jgi:hypothetical protein